jgi:glycosyltransferase involved in cell wall biosynthesis
MACGCPVIASNTTSIPEIVGKAGILLDPTDCDALAGAIEDLLANPDLQDNLVHKGLEQSRKFSWTMTANKTLEVYREVLSKNAN